MTDTKFITVKEAAGYLRVSRTTIQRLCCNDSSFPHIRIGKRILIDKDLFFEWVKNRIQ